MEALLEGKLNRLSETASRLKPAVAPQVLALRKVVSDADKILSASEPCAREMYDEVFEVMTKVVDMYDSTHPMKDELHHYYGALAAAIGGFVFLDVQKPWLPVWRAKGFAHEHVEKLRGMDADTIEFADAIDSFVIALCEYVKHNVGKPLVWDNPRDLDPEKMTQLAQAGKLKTGEVDKEKEGEEK